jgi:hypothetical protein
VSRQRKLNPEEVQRIIDRVRAGEYLSQIARGTGFNTSIIKATAHRAGLVIQKLTDEQVAANARAGRLKVKPVVPVVKSVALTLEQHYKGLKASLRWGGGMGA